MMPDRRVIFDVLFIVKCIVFLGIFNFLFITPNSVRALSLHSPTTGLEPQTFDLTTGPQRFQYLIRYWKRCRPQRVGIE